MSSISHEGILMGFVASYLSNDPNPGPELHRQFSDLTASPLTRRMSIELDLEDYLDMDFGALV